MENQVSNSDQAFTKDYTKMGVSAITPILLVLLGELVSHKTKIGGNILFALSAISTLYTAKVFY